MTGRCFGGDNGPFLKIRLNNLTTQTGTLNALLTDQQAVDGGVTIDTSGEFVGAGVTVTLDTVDTDNDEYLASGAFNRVEGQAVFQTPGRVTTIDFPRLHRGRALRVLRHGGDLEPELKAKRRSKPPALRTDESQPTGSKCPGWSSLLR